MHRNLREFFGWETEKQTNGTNSTSVSDLQVWISNFLDSGVLWFPIHWIPVSLYPIPWTLSPGPSPLDPIPVIPFLIKMGCKYPWWVPGLISHRWAKISYLVAQEATPELMSYQIYIHQKYFSSKYDVGRTKIVSPCPLLFVIFWILSENFIQNPIFEQIWFIFE